MFSWHFKMPKLIFWQTFKKTTKVEPLFFVVLGLKGNDLRAKPCSKSTINMLKKINGRCLSVIADLSKSVWIRTWPFLLTSICWRNICVVSSFLAMAFLTLNACMWNSLQIVNISPNITSLHEVRKTQIVRKNKIEKISWMVCAFLKANSDGYYLGKILLKNSTKTTSNENKRNKPSFYIVKTSYYIPPECFPSNRPVAFPDIDDIFVFENTGQFSGGKFHNLHPHQGWEANKICDSSHSRIVNLALFSAGFNIKHNKINKS